jgi:hypothetical protein
MPATLILNSLSVRLGFPMIVYRISGATIQWHKIGHLVHYIHAGRQESLFGHRLHRSRLHLPLARRGLPLHPLEMRKTVSCSLLIAELTNTRNLRPLSLI